MTTIYRYLTLCFLLIAITYCKAGNTLMLCVDCDKAGNCMGNYKTWAIESDGDAISILFKSDELLTKNYYAVIAKADNRIDTNYKVLDTVILKSDSSKNWIVKDYTFNKPGLYKISVFEENNDVPLQSYYTSMRYLDAQYNTLDIDTWYYKNVEMAFGDSVMRDYVIGKNTVFKYSPAGSTVSMYITHDDDKQLKTASITAKIYDADKNLVDTKTYTIAPTSRWFATPITFSKKGNYEVDLFNDKDIFIKSKHVEIK